MNHLQFFPTIDIAAKQKFAMFSRASPRTCQILPPHKPVGCLRRTSGWPPIASPVASTKAMNSHSQTIRRRRAHEECWRGTATFSPRRATDMKKQGASLQRSVRNPLWCTFVLSVELVGQHDFRRTVYVKFLFTGAEHGREVVQCTSFFKSTMIDSRCTTRLLPPERKSSVHVPSDSNIS